LKEIVVPEDFLKELKKNKTAFTNFFNYSLNKESIYSQNNQGKKAGNPSKKNSGDRVLLGKKY
jgi:hypothetical protein